MCVTCGRQLLRTTFWCTTTLVKVWNSSTTATVSDAPTHRVGHALTRVLPTQSTPCSDGYVHRLRYRNGAGVVKPTSRQCQASGANHGRHPQRAFQWDMRAFQGSCTPVCLPLTGICAIACCALRWCDKLLHSRSALPYNVIGRCGSSERRTC